MSNLILALNKRYIRKFRNVRISLVFINTTDVVNPDMVQ